MVNQTMFQRDTKFGCKLYEVNDDDDDEFMMMMNIND